MKISLVFDGWLDKEGKSIYHTAVGIRLSSGIFHSGTTFNGEIRLDENDAFELQSALEAGYRPVFYVMPD